MKPATVAALIPVTRCMLEARGEELTEESVYRVVRTLPASMWRALTEAVGCTALTTEVVEQVALQLAAEYLIEEDRHTIPDMPVLLPSGVWH